MAGQDAERGPSLHDGCLGPVSETVSSVTLQCLSWIKTVFEFYTAPVVKFWFHTISYLGFLMLFSYVILVKMGDQPSTQEWLVIVYILSTAVEKTREVMMSEPRKLSQKLKIWFSEYWNISDFVAILLFLAGLVMRFLDDPFQTAGRISYCLDIIFWFVRLMDLLAVNQHAGPYLTMITKMTRNMFFIVVMMAIVLLSFGVSRKSILYPDEEPSWCLARDVVFEPYWMIYGEVYAEKIDNKTKHSQIRGKEKEIEFWTKNPGCSARQSHKCDDDSPCPPGAFLTPFLQAVYMFFQYIIMVNILIAFFNNIYFDMESTSSKLWKYNRYRYIMTYQDRPWLPPPLILLSHMTLGLRAIYRRCRRNAEQGERGSGLKLLLGHEDRKKLHEFEEKCVQVYFLEKSDDVHSSQTKRIRATAERAEEMCMIVGEVSEKVIFVQDSLSELDSQLGQLQDLSVLAVDTLTLLSASDSLHQKEARLAQCGSVMASQHILPHSWTLPHRSGAECDMLNMGRMMSKSCKSTPPSLLKGFTLAGSRLASQECHVRRSKGGRQRHTEEGEEKRAKEDSQYAAEHFGENWQGGFKPASHPSLSHGGGVLLGGFRGQTPCEPCGPSRSGSPFFPKGLESPHHKLWTCDPYLYPSQEETSMEEDEEKEEEQRGLSKSEVSKASSNVLLLSDPQDISEGLVNPAFSQGDLSSSQPRPLKSSRRTCLSRDHPYGYCRSLSSSVENMTFSGALLSEMRGSFPSLNEPMNREGLPFGRGFKDNTSGRCSRSREWSKSSDFTQVDRRERIQNRKTVKIQEKSPDSSLLSDACWRRLKRPKGEPKCWSASTSLSQLNFEPVDLLQKQVCSHQDMCSPTHLAWHSLAKSMSRRSSLQSGIAPEVKSLSFQSTENFYSHYSAMEKNNLMRLAHTIPFTPVSILGGEEVSIYSLEEVTSESSTVSSWSSQGLSALLQPLSSEEGSLDGGLRQGLRVLCTWAEQDVLRPGLVYVVKAFRPEVVRAWQRYFHGSTALQLCLREIQQQRAAQKMMQVFNQIKPEDIYYSPRFLDVSLVLWQSNGQWLTIENHMSGDFRKYNNNTGEEIAPCCSLEELLLAFSHWTYDYSCRELLVLDLQGVGEVLTDPTVIMADDQSGSRGEMLFGPDNLGDAAIKGFLQKHSCGACCLRLGLSDLRKRPDSCRAEKTPGKEDVKSGM